jgi:predicted nucleotidyltransferase
MADIFIDEKSLAEIRRIIKNLCPKAVVWAYGGRVAGGKTAHGGSDLDLTVRNFGRMEHSLAGLKEAFKESNIPFLIDVSDFNLLPADFQKEIIKKYAVIYDGSN